MTNAWIFLGRAVFWLSWPALWVILKFGRRTRAIIEHDGRILVLKGWLGSGSWHLPGGGLHKGEETLQGLAREIKEETGITIDQNKAKYLGGGRAVNHGLSFKYEAFVIVLNEKPEVLPRRSEILEAKWLLPTELSPANASNDLLEVVDLWNRL